MTALGRQTGGLEETGDSGPPGGPHSGPRRVRRPERGHRPDRVALGEGQPGNGVEVEGQGFQRPNIVHLIQPRLQGRSRLGAVACSEMGHGHLARGLCLKHLVVEAPGQVERLLVTGERLSELSIQCPHRALEAERVAEKEVILQLPGQCHGGIDLLSGFDARDVFDRHRSGDHET